MTTNSPRIAFRATAVTALLSALMVGAASARILVLPKTIPAQPVAGQINAACGGDVRARSLEILASLRTAYDASAKSESQGSPQLDSSTGLRTVAVYSGGQHYITFKLQKNVAKISTPDFLDCINLYGGTADMVRRLGLFVPGDSTERGSFIYTPRIGIYVDPRLIVPAGSHNQ